MEGSRLRDAEALVSVLAAEQAKKGNGAMSTLAWLCRSGVAVPLDDGTELRVKAPRVRRATDRLDLVRVSQRDVRGNVYRSWTIDARGVVEERAMRKRRARAHDPASPGRGP